MFKSKKLLSMLLLCIVLLGTTSVFAERPEGIIVTEPYSEDIPLIDPIPRLDDGVINLFPSKSSPRVTASDVKVYDKGSSDYYDRYYVRGYVTMKRGSNDFYHYTRAENDMSSAIGLVLSSNNIWGTGKVTATTPTWYAYGTARVRYGW